MLFLTCFENAVIRTDIFDKCHYIPTFYYKLDIDSALNIPIPINYIIVIHDMHGNILKKIFKE